ncbi:MAG TPA: hypothetical protein VFF06_09330 [Polyangia bacterium]|nr:hypothetical protein [Polyangia bacterium]
MKPCVLVGLMVLAGGCARTPEALRAREAERARRARCYTVELYQFGLTPPRRYRVLGPVAVDADPIAARRDRALQEQACALGADAVVDIREDAAPLGGATEVQLQTVSGTAVAFVVDEPTPAPPPQ